MANNITMLHLSDLHVKLADKDKIQARAGALVEDLLQQKVNPDLVLVTGDIAYSGKKEEYELAEELIFKPLRHKVQISPKKVFFVPGNHDVDRSLINQMEETGLKANLRTASDAEKAFRSEHNGARRLSGYLDFTRSKPNGSGDLFSVHTSVVRGLEVGIACLNSAWRCSGKDQRKLFLTHQQVNGAADLLDRCVLRVALLHHPFDWFHPTESEVLEDLKRRFEIILTGHLHEQVTIAEQTTSHDSLFFTVPAFFEGHANWEGYNLYSTNLEDRSLNAVFRKFVKRRNEFDADTAHARGGQHRFNLPVRDIAKFSRAVSVQRIDACKSKLQIAIKQQLQTIQKVANPVLVTPKISRVTWSNGARLQKPLQGSLLDITRQNAVIFGPDDSGKTILLQSLAADLNEARISGQDCRIGVYADCSGNNLCNRELFEHFLDTTLEENLPGEQFTNAVILLDNVGDKNIAVFDLVQTLAAEKDLIFLIAVGSDLLFDAVRQKDGFEKWDFYQLSYWGPSRIREFVTKYFEGTSIDVDAAYNFVSASLEDTDLPANPWIVALYLSIFPTLGKQVSSLSFLRLLERIEEDRLGRIETSSTDSLYNKREILMRLAQMCLEDCRISIDRNRVEEMIKNFFAQKYLSVDATAFLVSLSESGLLSIAADSVRFSYFAFFDYFLARAFERRLLELDSVLTSLKGSLAVGQALCLYGGLFRENGKIATILLEFVSTAFVREKTYTLKELDRHINDLLVEHDSESSAEEIADKDLKKKINYNDYDADFEQRKDAQVRQRSFLLNAEDPTSKLEQLSNKILALKTFYNLFRNLENLDGAQKVTLLNRVLDFHIQCNIDLVEFFHAVRANDSNADFQSYVAYIVTMGGQVFLANNIGNQSLEETIRAARVNCENDLKELLLVCLYADLRLTGFQKELEDYVTKTNSLLAAELVYLKTRLLLVTHEARVIPTSLIAAFQAAFRRRHELLGGRSTQGLYGKVSSYHSAYSKEFEEAKKQHLQFFNAKESILKAHVYE